MVPPVQVYVTKKILGKVSEVKKRDLFCLKTSTLSFELDGWTFPKCYRSLTGFHVVIAHDFSTEEALRLLCSISLSLFKLFINNFEGVMTFGKSYQSQGNF